jgi:hypothetical protein
VFICVELESAVHHQAYESERAVNLRSHAILDPVGNGRCVSTVWTSLGSIADRDRKNPYTNNRI